MPGPFRSLRKKLSTARFGFLNQSTPTYSISQDADHESVDSDAQSNSCGFPRLSLRHKKNNELLSALREDAKKLAWNSSSAIVEKEAKSDFDEDANVGGARSLETVVSDHGPDRQSSELDTVIQGFFRREESARSAQAKQQLANSDVVEASQPPGRTRTEAVRSAFSNIMEMATTMPPGVFGNTTSGQTTSSEFMTVEALGHTDDRSEVSGWEDDDNTSDGGQTIVPSSFDPLVLDRLDVAQGSTLDQQSEMQPFADGDLDKIADPSELTDTRRTTTADDFPSTIKWRGEATEVPTLPFPMVDEGKFTTLHGPWRANTDDVSKPKLNDTAFVQNPHVRAENMLKHATNRVDTELKALRASNEAGYDRAYAINVKSAALREELLKLQQILSDKRAYLKQLNLKISEYEEQQGTLEGNKQA